jgi:protein TonB
MTALRLLATMTLLSVSQVTPAFAQMDTPVRIGQGIDPPRKTLHVAPVYPAVAQAAGVAGVVILEATIDREGRVANARVLRSIPLLDQAAVDAVRQWQFSPTLLNGAPVAVIMTVTVNFTLTQKSPSSPSSAPMITSPYSGGTLQVPQSPIAKPTMPQLPMQTTRPGAVATGDVDFMKTYKETIGTLQQEAATDPELRQLLANLQRMLEANGLSASLPSPPAAPVPSGARAPAAPCASPSYSVSGLRWERFPIRVYIEQVDLTRRGYSDQRRAEITRLIMQGLGSWSQATGGRVGNVTLVPDFADANLNVVFRNGTGNTIHDAVQSGTIRHATILWDVDRWEAFSDKDHRIVNGLAHEMGHVLGIAAHPTTPNTLMVDGPEQLTFEGPQPADVAAILAKYGICK